MNSPTTTPTTITTTLNAPSMGPELVAASHLMSRMEIQASTLRDLLLLAIEALGDNRATDTERALTLCVAAREIADRVCSFSVLGHRVCHGGGHDGLQWFVSPEDNEAFQQLKQSRSAS